MDSSLRDLRGVAERIPNAVEGDYICIGIDTKHFNYRPGVSGDDEGPRTPSHVHKVDSFFIVSDIFMYSDEIFRFMVFFNSGQALVAEK
jgi:hypothetical protein